MQSPIDIIADNIAYNKKLEQDLLKYDDSLEDVDFMKLGKFRCVFWDVQCNNYVSPATVKYFQYQVNELICYDCQEGQKDWEEKHVNTAYQADTYKEMAI